MKPVPIRFGANAEMSEKGAPHGLSRAEAAPRGGSYHARTFLEEPACAFDADSLDAFRRSAAGGFFIVAGEGTKAHAHLVGQNTE